VVEASKSLVNVFVDCDWGNKNQDLSGKYGVRGYPTVVFTDSKGEVIAPLEDRSPEGVLKQIQQVAESSGASMIETWDEAAKVAKEQGKPVLYFFAGKGKDTDALEEALLDDSLEKAREVFVLAKSKISRENADAKRFGVASYSQPVILVLDPNAEEPEKAPLKKIVGRKTPKELLKELQSIQKPKGV
jgi:hypothetical protein